VRAGRLVTLTALGPDGCASVLLFGADRLDRLNVPDTCKAQMSACIRPPMVLMSDRGLALASVVASSLEWHDCLTGCGQARAGLLSEMAKHGLGESDLHGSVNFFSQVIPGDDERATLSYRSGHSVEGDCVTLRTELDLLLVVSTPRVGVRIDVTPAPVPGPDDASAQFRDESARALEMSGRVLA